MTPAILALFFQLSSWGSPCPEPVLFPIHHEWEWPYEKAVYSASCGTELRQVIVATDGYGAIYGTLYFAASEQKYHLPDIGNFTTP